MFRGRSDGSVSRFHVHASVALICIARRTVPRIGREVRGVQGLVLRGGALQLAEDGFLVVEEIADQAIGMALVHGQGVFHAGPQDAGREGLRERGDEGFVGRRELYQACNVCADGVEGGDVGEAQLTKGVLKDSDASGRVGRGVGGRVDGFDDFVDLAGNDAVREFEEVEFEDGGHDGDFIAFKNLARDSLAGVDAVAKVMGGSERDVNDPNAAAGFVALKVGIVC